LHGGIQLLNEYKTFSVHVSLKLCLPHSRFWKRYDIRKTFIWSCSYTIVVFRRDMIFERHFIWSCAYLIVFLGRDMIFGRYFIWSCSYLIMVFGRDMIFGRYFIWSCSYLIMVFGWEMICGRHFMMSVFSSSIDNGVFYSLIL
jgi:hypothetical protein